jgi:hypothetical protein
MKTMQEYYAYRIRTGQMTIDSVPEKWRAEVEKLLGMTEE